MSALQCLHTHVRSQDLTTNSLLTQVHVLQSESRAHNYFMHNKLNRTRVFTMFTQTQITRVSTTNACALSSTGQIYLGSGRSFSQQNIFARDTQNNLFAKPVQLCTPFTTHLSVTQK